MSILKKYWNIFCGACFGLLSSFLLKWHIDIGKIRLIYSGVILIIIYLWVMSKKSCKPSIKGKILIGKVVENQGTIKAVEVSKNPTEESSKEDEIITIVLEQMKGWKKQMQKIKNLFKWIWAYKEQLIGYLGALIYLGITVYAYATDRFGWLLQNFPQTLAWEIIVKVLVGLISIVFIYYILRNQAKHVGFGNLEYATSYLKEKNKELNSALSTTSQKIVEEKIVQLKQVVKPVYDSYEQIKNQHNLLVQRLHAEAELSEYGVGNAEKVGQLKQELAIVKAQLDQYEKDIASVEKEIKDNEKVLYQ